MAPDHRPPADAAATGLGRMAKPAGQTSRRSPWSSGRNQEAQCPACAAPVNAGDRYCEACGQELGAPVVAAPVVVAPGAVAPGALVVGAYGLDAGTGQWLSSAGPLQPDQDRIERAAGQTRVMHEIAGPDSPRFCSSSDQPD